MKNIAKKTVSAALALILVFSFAAAAFASNETLDEANKEPQPSRYTYISSIDAAFDISGITAYVDCALNAKVSTSLSIKAELQKLNSSSTYDTVKTWTASGSGYNLYLSETRAINILETYRLKVTFTAGTEKNIIYRYA